MDHKEIGVLYLYLGSWSGMVGLVFRVMMRTELLHRGRFFGEIIYNIVVTSHGLLMIFFMVMPLMIGYFGNWLVPVLLHVPDMCFGRVNSFRFWLLPVSLFLVLLSRCVEDGVGTGWTLYPPLSG